MAARELWPGLSIIPLSFVNLYLIEGDGLTLIDAGLPGTAEKILGEIRGLGKDPKQLRRIVLTHAHPDHIGALGPLIEATGAEVYAHRLDAPIARQGDGFRPFSPSPTFVNRLLFKIFFRPYSGLSTATVDHELEGDEVLAFAGDLQAIFTPGHSDGHLAYLWPQHGGVLIAGDICANMFGLDWSMGYENFAVGQESLRRVSALDFETACFGHGKPIMRGAAQAFRKKWG